MSYTNDTENRPAMMLTPLGLLYFSHFTFLLIGFTNAPSSAANIYFFNLIFIGVLIIYLLRLDGLSLKVNRNFSIAIISIFSFVLALQLVNSDVYLTILVVKLIFLVQFFSRADISRADFITFVNLSYFVYFAISVFYWVFFPDAALNTRLGNEEFSVQLMGYNFQAMPGFRGSPSQIDSYSAVILILNASINSKQKFRKLIMTCAILALVFSFRLTPLMGLLIVAVFSPLLRRRFFFVLCQLFGIVILIGLISTLYLTPSVEFFGVSLRDIAYISTHARSDIWVAQMKVMVENYSVLNYLFGGFDAETFAVPLMQLSGLDTQRLSMNPHNNYLLLFLRSPLIFLAVLLIFYWQCFKNLSSNYFFLFTFILIAAHTNSSLIGLENPIYIYILIYFLLLGRKKSLVKTRYD